VNELQSVETNAEAPIKNICVPKKAIIAAGQMPSALGSREARDRLSRGA
jgi:hypothetical protein